MKLLAKLAIGTAGVCLPVAAQAAIIIDISQVGANVVTTLSGSLDLTGLIRREGIFTSDSNVRGSAARFGTGTSGASTRAYTGFDGPASFGPGAFLTSASSSSGDPFGLNAGLDGRSRVLLAPGYASGAALTASSSYLNQSLASLGLTAGTYVYKSANDTITFNIGISAVPEPASWALMITGFGIVGAVLRRRSAVRTTVRFA